MKSKLKWLIPAICVCLVAAVSVAYFYTKRPETMPTEIRRIQSDHAINVDDPREVIGDADYTFIALVQSTQDVFHAKRSSDFPEIILKAELPRTECTIKVIKNIKGTLEENSIIKIYKSGGISPDGKYLELDENDSLPQPGKYYIFTAYAQKDGTLTVGGAYASVELEKDFSPEKVGDSALVAKYEDAYKNQIAGRRKEEDRHLAKYDIKNKTGSQPTDTPTATPSDTTTTSVNLLIREIK